MLKRLPLLIMNITVLLLLSNCEDEDDTIVLLSELSATFSGDWSDPNGGPGTLLYSDLDGSVLWSGTWTGNDTIMATYEAGFPARMSMTTVTYDEERNYVLIVTNMNVKSDNYIWYGGGATYRWRESIGDIHLNFANDPGHQGYYVSSKYAYRRSSSRSLSSDFDQSLYSMDDNLFIRINPNSGMPRYSWTPDVSPGDTIAVDLGSMIEMQSTNISLPGTELEPHVFIKGFNDSYYSGYYGVQTNFGITSTDLDVYYPDNLFSAYRSYMILEEESYPTNNYWYHSVVGGIPSSLNQLISDFSFVDESEHDVAISTVGDYTQLYYNWGYENQDGTSFSWVVYTDLEALTLPALPQSFFSTYPDFDIDSLNLSVAGISLYDDLSYDAHIDLFFKSGMGFFELIEDVKTRYRDPNGLRSE